MPIDRRRRGRPGAGGRARVGDPSVCAERAAGADSTTRRRARAGSAGPVRPPGLARVCVKFRAAADGGALGRARRGGLPRVAERPAVYGRNDPDEDLFARARVAVFLAGSGRADLASPETRTRGRAPDARPTCAGDSAASSGDRWPRAPPCLDRCRQRRARPGWFARRARTRQRGPGGNRRGTRLRGPRRTRRHARRARDAWVAKRGSTWGASTKPTACWGRRWRRRATGRIRRTWLRAGSRWRAVRTGAGSMPMPRPSARRPSAERCRRTARSARAARLAHRDWSGRLSVARCRWPWGSRSSDRRHTPPPSRRRRRARRRLFTSPSAT